MHSPVGGIACEGPPTVRDSRQVSREEGRVSVLCHGEIGKGEIQPVVEQAAFDAELFRVAGNRREVAAAFGLALEIGFFQCIVAFGDARIAGIGGE